MKVKKLESFIEVPEEIEVLFKDNLLTAKGKKGEVVRSFINPTIQISLEGKKITFSASNATKREKKLMNCLISHVKNMIRGANEGHIYKLKVCSGHFPINVSIQGKEFIVKNFLGEKYPRKLLLKNNLNVKIEGDIIIVESCYKELAGQTAADIEMLTKIRGRDLRIFQDGIWIINKDGKEVK